ncbi:hypothetical protein CHCC5023_4536 [Bacillus paralicheniformis]|nr:hypothetical protein CHCC5023_4536 [Bacillus paralicheniformis]TWJ82154.1 hypothetical protein CHCC5019_1036 [Bacillus paralicheniformis]
MKQRSLIIQFSQVSLSFSPHKCHQQTARASVEPPFASPIFDPK